jgi:hypothetical protein
MDGRWVGLDLLAGPGLFGRAWPRLCAGYVADAIGREVKPWQRLDVGAVLSRLGDGQAEPAPAVGLGQEHRLAIPELAGSVLVGQGRVPTSWRSPVSGRTTMETSKGTRMH